MTPPDRLRILMTSYYMPSISKIGVGHQVHALANAMVDRGHEVTVVTPAPPSDGARYLTLTLAVAAPLRTFRWAFALRRLDMSHYDVLHSHGDDYWLWRRRVPVHIRTMHGSCFEEALRIPRPKEKLRMLLLGLGEVLATRVADETVAVSRNTTRTMPWIKRVIPNGVDPERFTRPDITRENRPTILFVGTYRNRKRGHLLVETFIEQVQPAIPDAQLWMVCEDAPSDLDGVEVLGRLSDTELAERYQRAWVFCLPSTYEGFGIPYVEAMAAGLPLVVTPNPGSREVTDNGGFGALVADRALGAELITMLRDSAQREYLATTGRAHVHRNYTLNRVCNLYEDLYAASAP